jgi:apolipoprotein D and lipocalin family protein
MRSGASEFSFVPGDPLRSISSAADQVRSAISNLLRKAPISGAALPTAGPIDAQKYSGKWYELARLPVRFQDPRSVSTAEYGLRPDGKISVLNTAYVGDKVSAKINGTATALDPAQKDKLNVKFGGFLRFIPTPKEGNYWILDIDKDYQTALVGSPDKKFMWLLARDPKSWDATVAQQMVKKATDLGFDTSKLLVADWDKRAIR